MTRFSRSTQLCLTFLAMLLFPSGDCVSDEGMYPISELARLDLASRGLELDVEKIFNTEETCLIDGICRVNGCTGSFVSGDGLIITNHHCAYRAIQSASSATQDYLRNGFSAPDRVSEIPATGYVVRITESFTDVSDQVLEVIQSGMSFGERTRAVDRRRKEIEKAAEQANPNMRAEVAEMFTGKTYVLFLYTFIKDVRLVFAPPASVGAFGGDVDNWEWPRHTGDFSFMRAYVSPEGKSVEYSKDNVPYQPKTFIPVAAEGVDEGDFVMLLGYPGRTARHKTASFLRYEENVRLPYVVKNYQWQISEMEKASEGDRAVALKHTSRIKGLANVEKRSRGQLKGLRRAGIVAARSADETRLQSFIDGVPERRSRFGGLLDEIAAVYEEMTRSAEYELNLQNLRSASRLMSMAFTIFDAAVERQKEDLERESQYMDRNFDRTLARLRLTFRDLHLPTDKVILRGMLERLSKNNSARNLPALQKSLESKEAADRFVDTLFEYTRLSDAEFLDSCLKMTPDELRKADDSFLNLVVDLYPEFCRLRDLNKEREGRLGRAYGELLTVKRMFLDTNFVPDANGTLRLTFGTIRGYSPEDAVYKSPITTLGGVVAKTTGEEPFVTPQRILDLHAAKEFGRFVHPKLNDIPVAILYDTDTTGGNSGSPILNSKGELVGVNFDRAFEATINDFAWNQSYSRSLGVDVRYALWITGKVFGATHLLDEMGVKK